MAAPKTDDWYFCPECGGKVKIGSEGCVTCAEKNPQTPDYEDWTAEADPGLADVPVGYSEEDEDFNYDEYIASEFGNKSRRSVNPVFVAIALAVFLMLLFLLITTGTI